MAFQHFIILEFSKAGGWISLIEKFYQSPVLIGLLNMGTNKYDMDEYINNDHIIIVTILFFT
ncbi:hypothetical protein ACJX0J_023874, partial [Zea mays]